MLVGISLYFLLLNGIKLSSIRDLFTSRKSPFHCKSVYSVLLATVMSTTVHHKSKQTTIWRNFWWEEKVTRVQYPSPWSNIWPSKLRTLHKHSLKLTFNIQNIFHLSIAPPTLEMTIFQMPNFLKYCSYQFPLKSMVIVKLNHCK